MAGKRGLDHLSNDVKNDWGIVLAAGRDGLDARIRVGKSLSVARTYFTADQAFGEWFDKQTFPFNTETGRRHRIAAEHEDELLALWDGDIAAGREPSFTNCYKRLRFVVESGPERPVPIEVATAYPASERVAWLDGTLSPLMPKAARRTKVIDQVEESTRAREESLQEAVLEVLCEEIPDITPDIKTRTAARLLALYRGDAGNGPALRSV